MVPVRRDSSYRIVAGTVKEISSSKQDKLCDNERIWLEWYGNAASSSSVYPVYYSFAIEARFQREFSSQLEEI